jgi:hypothetical protein
MSIENSGIGAPRLGRKNLEYQKLNQFPGHCERHCLFLMSYSTGSGLKFFGKIDSGTYNGTE